MVFGWGKLFGKKSGGQAPRKEIHAIVDAVSYRDHRFKIVERRNAIEVELLVADKNNEASRAAFVSLLRSLQDRTDLGLPQYEMARRPSGDFPANQVALEMDHDSKRRIIVIQDTDVETVKRAIAKLDAERSATLSYHGCSVSVVPYEDGESIMVTRVSQGPKNEEAFGALVDLLNHRKDLGLPERPSEHRKSENFITVDVDGDRIWVGTDHLDLVMSAIMKLNVERPASPNTAKTEEPQKTGGVDFAAFTSRLKHEHVPGEIRGPLTNRLRKAEEKGADLDAEVDNAGLDNKIRQKAHEALKESRRER